MYHCYLLYNLETKKFYIGTTHNLQRRISEHTKGMNTSTKYHCESWKLIYVETFVSQKDALHREKKLKVNGSGIRELKKRLLNSKQTLEQEGGAGKR